MKNTGDIRSRSSAKKRPSEVLAEFVDFFSAKGWLNQQLRIAHQKRKYRIFCSEGQFSAYRINDHWGVPPGLPGWFVCLVSNKHILEGSDTNDPHFEESLTSHWLQCLHCNDYELI